MAWPPTLDELKNDLAIPLDDVEDDDALQRRLDAAIGFVQRVRSDAFLLADDGTPVDPVELADDGREEVTLRLGVLMLAGRLFARRRSPDAVLLMAESGTTRVGWVDEDIHRLLRLGRNAKPRVG